MLYCVPQDVSNFVSVYQHKTDPAKAMADLAEDVGFEVVSCEAPELEFVFENINYLKSKYLWQRLREREAE